MEIVRNALELQAQRDFLGQYGHVAHLVNEIIKDNSLTVMDIRRYSIDDVISGTYVELSLILDDLPTILSRFGLSTLSAKQITKQLREDLVYQRELQRLIESYIKKNSTPFQDYWSESIFNAILNSTNISSSLYTSEHDIDIAVRHWLLDYCYEQSLLSYEDHKDNLMKYTCGALKDMILLNIPSSDHCLYLEYQHEFNLVENYRKALTDHFLISN